MVKGTGHRANSRTFPPVPEPELAKRGRRQHLLEKAIAIEDAKRQRREAARLREHRAREKQQRQRLKARRVAVRAFFAPALALLNGSGQALLRIGEVTVRSLAALRSSWARLVGNIKSSWGAVVATPGRIVRGVGSGLARIAAAAWATLKALLFFGPAKIIRNVTLVSIGVLAGIGFLVVAIIHRSRNAVAEVIHWLRETLTVRRAAVYGYSAMVGLALVAVAGSLIVGVGSRNDAAGPENLLALAVPVPDTMPEISSTVPEPIDSDPILAVMALDPSPESEITRPEMTRSAMAIPPAKSVEPAKSAEVAPIIENEALTTLAPPVPTLVPGPAPVTGRARIAIVIDDMGMVQRMLPKFAALEGPLTFAFLPYASDLDEQTGFIRETRHQLLIHMPMEPKARSMDPGPNALLTGLAPDELARRIAWNLDRFDGYVGINNHMGSRFTENSRAMRAVIRAAKARHLFFFDSMTSAKSVGYGVAGEAGVPRVQRDIFLDNERTVRAVNRQLRRLEALALRQGHAVAIGHPHKETLAALKAWIPTLNRKGIQLVVLSDLVERPTPAIKVAQRPAGAVSVSPGGLQE